MKDRIAGPRSVPTGSVRSFRFLLPIVLHLSLRTRFPSPPPSCPPLPTTCGFYSPATFAQRTNVSSRWALKPTADRWFPSMTSSSQRQEFKEMWAAPRLRRFGDLRLARRSLAWIAVHILSYTLYVLSCALCLPLRESTRNSRAAHNSPSGSKIRNFMSTRPKYGSRPVAELISDETNGSVLSPFADTNLNLERSNASRDGYEQWSNLATMTGYSRK